MESIRLRTDDHELIIAQQGNFILVVIQDGTMEQAPKGTTDLLLSNSNSNVPQM